VSNECISEIFLSTPVYSFGFVRSCFCEAHPLPPARVPSFKSPPTSMIAFDPSYSDDEFDPDTERMIRVSAGDAAAFEELVHRNFDSTVRIIHAMMGSDYQAEDLAQEVFLRVYRGRERYVPKAKFSTWLGTIIRNAVLNAKRSLSRRIQCLDCGGELPLDPAFQADSSSDGHELDRREVIASVGGAIAGLPDRQQTAIRLVHLQGKSYAGAAAEMKTSTKAVKSLLGRGRGTLVLQLDGTFQKYYCES
ncbi:MAG: RNA polymerase sigma factor, partial [Rubripirellula sp.]